MKLHYNPDRSEWLECRAAKGHCPFGDVGHQSQDQLIATAVSNHGHGEPTPVLKDTAGNIRTFEFHEDGSYTFGARTYDRHGALVPSDRTAKSWRLKEAHVADSKPDFAKLTAELKMYFLGPALIRHETTKGLLAGTQRESGLRFNDWQDYTREHHRGLFAWFFRTEWTQTSEEESIADRYRLTLQGMFGKVWSWARSRRRAA